MALSLREFIAACEAKGDVVHVTREVECSPEIGYALAANNKYKRSVIVFENVKGKDYPSVAGIFNDRAKALLALGATEADVYDKFIHGLSNPIDPVMYKGKVAPCQEVVLTGDEIDITKLPIPQFSVLDGGPFCTAGLTVSKDPETGVPDVGHYRYQVHDSKTFGYMAQPFHRFGKNCIKAKNMGKKTWQAAIVIGAAPMTGFFGPLIGVPETTNDFALMGGMLGEPVELVKCKTIDVEVPADAEFIIELEVDFEETRMEGPLGEFTGYMTPASPKWVSRVKCITHRKDPLFQILLTGKPVTENHILKNIPMEASMFKALKAQFPTIKDINVTPAGGCQTEVIISMAQRNYGDARSVILAAMATDLRPKYVVVVDPDIDVHDLNDVAWAIAYRSVPGRDTILVENVPSSPLDPSSYLPPMKGEPDWDKISKIRINGSLGIDATFGFGMEHEQIAEVVGWQDYKFPEIGVE